MGMGEMKTFVLRTLVKKIAAGENNWGNLSLVERQGNT